MLQNVICTSLSATSIGASNKTFPDSCNLTSLTQTTILPYSPEQIFYSSYIYFRIFEDCILYTVLSIWLNSLLLKCFLYFIRLNIYFSYSSSILKFFTIERDTAMRVLQITITQLKYYISIYRLHIIKVTF